MGKKAEQQVVASASTFVRPELGTFIGVEHKTVLIETAPRKTQNGSWVVTGIVAGSRMPVSFFGQTPADLPKMEPGVVYDVLADWTQMTRETANGQKLPVLRAKRVITADPAEAQDLTPFSMIKVNDEVRKFSPRNLIPASVAEAAGLMDA